MPQKNAGPRGDPEGGRGQTPGLPLPPASLPLDCKLTLKIESKRTMGRQGLYLFPSWAQGRVVLFA